MREEKTRLKISPKMHGFLRGRLSRFPAQGKKRSLVQRALQLLCEVGPRELQWRGLSLLFVASLKVRRECRFKCFAEEVARKADMRCRACVHEYVLAGTGIALWVVCNAGGQTDLSR